MFYPNLHQLEQRSVHTPTLDESVPQPLFDKRPSSISSRPYSAKDDSQPLRPTNVRPGRPVSASKQPPASMANLLHKRLPSPRKERDAQALARLRPRRIAIEKERLYDDAMHLKIENNDLRTENTKLKTRASQLDRELTRAQEKLEDAMADRSAAASAHLVAGLKQNIKDLRLAVKAKDMEVALMRKSARSTKVEELEVELQTYVEECRRLQTALNDVLRQDDTSEQDASKRELTQLRNDLKKARADHRAQQELITSLQGQLSQARTPPRDSRAEMLERQLNQNAQDKARLAEEHNAAMESLQRELAEASTKALEVERKQAEQIKELKEELRQTRQHGESHDSEVEFLTRAVEGKEAELDSLQQSLSALQQELEQAKYSCESLTDELSDLQDAKRRTEAQASKALADLEHANEEAGRLRSQLADSEAQISSLQAKARKKELETGALEEEHQTQLTALVMQHKKELSEAGTRSSALRELEDHNRKLKQDCKSLEAELERQSREGKTLQSALSHTQQERNSFQSRISDLEKDISDLRSELEIRSQNVSKILSPHFFRLKGQLSLVLDNLEMESADAFAERLKSASLDPSVVEMILLQVSDGCGNVSMLRLTEELQAAERLKPDTPQEEEEYSQDEEVPQAQEVISKEEEHIVPVETHAELQVGPESPKSLLEVQDEQEVQDSSSEQEAVDSPRSYHMVPEFPRNEGEAADLPVREEAVQETPRSEQESVVTPRSEHMVPDIPSSEEKEADIQHVAQDTPRSEPEAVESEHRREPLPAAEELAEEVPVDIFEAPLSEDRPAEELPSLPVEEVGDKALNEGFEEVESQEEQYSDSYEQVVEDPVAEEPNPPADTDIPQVLPEPIPNADIPYGLPADTDIPYVLPTDTDIPQVLPTDTDIPQVPLEPIPNADIPFVLPADTDIPQAIPESPRLPSDLPSSSEPDSDYERPQGPTPRDSQEDDQSARVPASPSAVRLADLCRHVSFRMQITRLAKQDLVNLLFEGEKQATAASVREHLAGSPLLITDPSDLDLLLSAMQISTEPLQAAPAANRLEAMMEDWRIFSQQDEDEFDREIAEALHPQAEDFLSLCETVDTAGSGLIAYSDFQTIVERLHMNLTPAHLQYLQLLFYSEGQQLDVVPYETLIHAYAGQEDDNVQELTETQTKAVRGQLEMLAAHAQGQRLDEVFGPDSRGFISPNAFLTGLASLGLPQPDDETLDLLFQSLQAEEADEVCIALADLEEILGSLQPAKSKKSSMSRLDE